MLKPFLYIPPPIQGFASCLNIQSCSIWRECTFQKNIYGQSAQARSNISAFLLSPILAYSLSHNTIESAEINWLFTNRTKDVAQYHNQGCRKVLRSYKVEMTLTQLAVILILGYVILVKSSMQSNKTYMILHWTQNLATNFGNILNQVTQS